VAGREDEIKFRLGGPQDRRKLLAGLPGVPEIERQENIYLDTPGFRMARSLAMLRIRTSPDRSDGAMLTLKRGTEVEAGYFQSLEVEAPLPPGAVDRIRRDPPAVYGLDLPPVAELKALFGELPLVAIGVLRNERTRIECGGRVLEIDRMTFPDGTEEYELEVETSDPAGTRAWLVRELTGLGVAAEPGRETKFERLLRKLGAVGPGRSGP
jgi:uncharacterized protein YjbK